MRDSGWICYIYLFTTVIQTPYEVISSYNRKLCFILQKPARDFQNQWNSAPTVLVAHQLIHFRLFFSCQQSLYAVAGKTKPWYNNAVSNSLVYICVNFAFVKNQSTNRQKWQQRIKLLPQSNLRPVHIKYGLTESKTDSKCDIFFLGKTLKIPQLHYTCIACCLWSARLI